jgi:hypothetical protein
MRIAQEDWKNAAINASNLSELELTLGEVALAVGDAEQSVTYADRSGDADIRMIMRTTHADALHQAGRRAEAEARFREAEQMQAERQPDYPLLYSLRGFQYCDLLLAAPERAAWQVMLRSAAVSERPAAAASPRQQAPNIPMGVAASGLAAGGPADTPALLEICRAISQRAAQTLKWVTDAKLGLLTVALEHLTLGRAALYEAILERSAVLLAAATPNDPAAAGSACAFFPADAAAGHRPALLSLQTARRELDAAVDGLRRAATQDHIPRGLLTRAWLRFLTGARTGPESDKKIWKKPGKSPSAAP